jgi:hypothetical protein
MGMGGAAPGGSGGVSVAGTTGASGTAGSGGSGLGGGGASAVTAGSGGGGSGGGGGGGSGSGGGASACQGLICEDFETGSIDLKKWDLQTKGGTATVQTQQVATGKYALQVHALASGGDDWAMLVAKDAPAALKGKTTFGRAHFYYAADATASLHMTLQYAGTNGTGTANGPEPFPKLRRLETGTYFGSWQLGMDLHDIAPLVEVVSHPTAKPPTNKWFCLEWEFEDEPDRITVWVDGTKAGTFDTSNAGSGGAIYNGQSSGIIGGFDTFGVGVHDWHPTKAFDLYYDDIVLDAKKIGCPAAP